MQLSLQRSRDNPKDNDDWKIYPPHNENKKKEVGEDFEFEECKIPGVHEVRLVFMCGKYSCRKFTNFSFSTTSD